MYVSAGTVYIFNVLYNTNQKFLESFNICEMIMLKNKCIANHLIYFSHLYLFRAVGSFVISHRSSVRNLYGTFIANTVPYIDHTLHSNMEKTRYLYTIKSKDLRNKGFIGHLSTIVIPG